MWEWSKPKQNNCFASAAEKDSSLLSAYDDLLAEGTQPSAHPFRSAAEQRPREEAPGIQEMYGLVERRLHEYKLDRFEIVERPYSPQSWTDMNRLYEEFQRTRVIFLKRLAYAEQENCRAVGLDDEDIALLKKGLTPENVNTHLQIPFDFGGTAELSNLCLLRTHPVHENIHKILDLQFNNNFLKLQKRLLIPWYGGKIYHDRRR